ncbi:hypothetical protein ACJW31_05G158100 [Castanea mollissima]
MYSLLSAMYSLLQYIHLALGLPSSSINFSKWSQTVDGDFLLLGLEEDITYGGRGGLIVGLAVATLGCLGSIESMT